MVTRLKKWLLWLPDGCVENMDDYIKRIKDMYNACAKNFSLYLADHDIRGFTDRSIEIKAEYGCTEDIDTLLWWFIPKVQAIHDRWEKEHGK